MVLTTSNSPRVHNFRPSDQRNIPRVTNSYQLPDVNNKQYQNNKLVRSEGKVRLNEIGCLILKGITNSPVLTYREKSAYKAMLKSLNYNLNAAINSRDL